MLSSPLMTLRTRSRSLRCSLAKTVPCSKSRNRNHDPAYTYSSLSPPQPLPGHPGTEFPRNEESDSMFDRINWKRLIQDDTIIENIKRRHETANVDRIRQLWEQLHTQGTSHKGHIGTSPENRRALKEELVKEALRFPNDTHKAALDCGETPVVLRTVGQPLSMEKPKEFQDLSEPRGYLKRNNLGDLIGTRPYILKGFLAELEQALVNYTVDALREEGFQLISVPDFLYSHVIESCGFPVKSDRTMVYEIETEEGGTPIYLSGTSEMAIAGYLSNRTFPKSELPLKLAAVSRCYRAEVSSIEEERGIYRVHNFSKVEMYSVTTSEGTASEDHHDSILSLQEKLFSNLGLQYRVLEMPANELGSPAYRKYDIEAWMPGRKQFGEISSCSNCTDYQSRRLNIRHRDDSYSEPFVHTLNGTACAIPRMLIALIESNQTQDGNVILPPVLQKYMSSKWNSNLSKLRQDSLFMKNRKQQEKVVLRYDPWREGVTSDG